jgi:hypothetical protein
MNEDQKIKIDSTNVLEVMRSIKKAQMIEPNMLHLQPKLL